MNLGLIEKFKLTNFVAVTTTCPQLQGEARKINPIFKKLSLVTIAASSTLSLLFTTPATAITFNLDQKFTAPDSAALDNFGSSVAIDGNFALISSIGDDDNGSGSGSAYLFDIASGSLLQKFIAPDGATGDQFGVSVAIDGNFALIGSRLDDDNGSGSGSAYLFDITSGSLLQKFIAPDGATGDTFGFSVAIDGNNALIGASFDDDNGPSSGSAYLFDIASGSLLQKFIAPDGASVDEFGFSVTIDGNNALIGALLDDDKGTDSGSAYLFDIPSGSLLQKFTAPDGVTNAQFGNSVAIDGNNALIGALLDDDNGTDSGSAYLFDIPSGSLLQKFIAPDGVTNAQFGGSVSIDGNNALIGARFGDDNGTDSGSAYLFDVASGVLLQKLTAPNGASGDRFGVSVAIDGNNTLIGSIGDDDNGENSGSAYLFTTEENSQSVPEPSTLLGLGLALGLGALSLKKKAEGISREIDN